MPIFDDDGVLMGQAYDDKPKPLPLMVETLGAQSAATIARLYGSGGTIPDQHGVTHNVRQAIDQMLWRKRRKQAGDQAQAQPPQWW